MPSSHGQALTQASAEASDPGSDVPPETSEPAPDPCSDYGSGDFPPTGWSPEAWEPYAAGDTAEKLRAVQTALPGHWHGEAKTSWTTPYLIDLTFREDGTYSAVCSNIPAECCTAFSYGTDDDTPLKRYHPLDAKLLAGDVVGKIDIVFEYGDGYGLPGWQGELSQIERDASGNGLRFRFRTSATSLPLEYDLRRVTEP